MSVSFAVGRVSKPFFLHVPCHHLDRQPQVLYVEVLVRNASACSCKKVSTAGYNGKPPPACHHTLILIPDQLVIHSDHTRANPAEEVVVQVTLDVPLVQRLHPANLDLLHKNVLVGPSGSPEVQPNRCVLLKGIAVP